MNFSYWERQFISDTADLVVIGAGITGMSTAYHASINHPDWKIIIIEKFPLGNAASTRNAGFSCFGSAGELVDDLNSGESLDSVLKTVEKRFKGLELLRKTIGDKHLEHVSCGGYELFDSDQENEHINILSKLDTLNSELQSITKTKETYTSDKVPTSLDQFNYCIYNSLEGKLNPGKMMSSWEKICKERGIDIYKGTEASLTANFEGVYLENHLIRVSRIAICTNGLSGSLGLELKVQPARNLVLLSKPLPQLHLPSTYHHQKGYIYFRMIHNRLLIGGGRHHFLEEENTSNFQINNKLKSYLLNYLQDHFGLHSEQIDQEWTGIMGVGKSKDPIVKRIKENVVCGVRLGGMGVAMGTLIGKQVSELLD